MLSYVNVYDANKDDELIAQVYPSTEEFTIDLSNITEKDRELKLYMIAMFSSGAYTRQSSELNLIINGTKLLIQNNTQEETLTGTSTDVTFKLDLSSYTIEPVDSSVDLFSFECKKLNDSSWTALNIVSTDYADSIYTVVVTIPTSTDDVYMIRANYTDWNGTASGYYNKIYNKNCRLCIGAEGSPDLLLVGADPSTDKLLI